MRYGFTIFIIAVFGLINPTLSAQGSLVEGFAFEQNTKLGRGVNIIGYDSLWHFADKARMKDKHFRLIKNAGFDNVRIVIMPFKFSLNDVDFKLDQKFFKTLDWAVTQSLENNLMAIIDFHEHHAMQEDPLGNKPMFLSMWKQIAEHYKDSPSSVLFEIANEPNMNPEIWNEIHKEALALLRESNPDRTILIGPIYGNQIKHLKDLELPENDRNLIIAVHYYSPIQFTHQGAPWSSNTKDLSGITWTNLPEEEQAIIDDFDIAQKWSKKYNRPITLGEFGAYEKAELPSRIRWTSFVARHAESLGWSWSYWQFDSDFIVYDIDKDEWFEPILNALIPENKPKKN